MVSRATSYCRIGAFEAENTQIQFVDECIDDAHRVVFADIVIQAFRQQHALMSVCAFDESLHGPPRWERAPHFIFGSAFEEAFSHSLGPKAISERDKKRPIKKWLQLQRVEASPKGLDLGVQE